MRSQLNLHMSDELQKSKLENCIRPQNFVTGVSDCINLIGTLINVNVPKFKKRKIQNTSLALLMQMP